MKPYPATFPSDGHTLSAAVFQPCLCALRKWKAFVREKFERALLYAIAWSLWAVVAKDPSLSMPIGLLVRWDDKRWANSSTGRRTRRPQSE